MNSRSIQSALALSTLTGVAAAQNCQPVWTALPGAGLNSNVRVLVPFTDTSGPALYAGGPFTAAGGAPASRIARWGGPAVGWSTLGSGTNSSVNALAVFDDGSGPALYAGGTFDTAGGVPASSIARWNGQSGVWS